jgi:site-specific DNA-methyltransferase (adenine-specific)
MELMGRYPDKHFDLAIVDPPYFNGPQKLGYYGLGYSKIGVERQEYKKIGKWDVPGQEYYNELCRVSNNQIIFGINYFTFTGIKAGRIIWDKQKAYGLSFSEAEIAYCSLINSVKFFRFRWDGMLQGNMKNKEHRIHPTQKPVALYKWLLSKYAKPGWKILDTHLGSGSSAIACYDMGFALTACEIDGDYFDGAVERLRGFAAQGTLDFGGNR